MTQFHKFGLVMGANFEAIASMAAAYYSAQWLNAHYPKGFDWASVTYVLGLLLIARSWYVVLRVLMRDQRTSEAASEKGATENDSRNA
ncbi:MAG: hypothetical protein H7318_08700 [Oligoflexus sp.]|nr:hypothetical protein [Oligoflexus sp.]